MVRSNARTTRRIARVTLAIASLVMALANRAAATGEDEPTRWLEETVDATAVDADVDARSRANDVVMIGSDDVMRVNDAWTDETSWSAEDVARDARFRPRRAGPIFLDGYDGIDGTMLVTTFDVEPYGVAYGAGFGTLPGYAFATSLDCELCSDVLSRLSLAVTIAAFVLIGIYCIAKFEDDDDAIGGDGRCRCCRGHATFVIDARALAQLASSESAFVVEGKTASEAKSA